MKVKELMEMLSKQDPDNEVTFIKKTRVHEYDRSYYEYDIMDEDLVKITSTKPCFDICF